MDGDFEKFPYAKYDEALESAKNGNYEDAITAFEALENYNNINQQVIECKYNWAIQLTEAGNYTKAIHA